MDEGIAPWSLPWIRFCTTMYSLKSIHIILFGNFYFIINVYGVVRAVLVGYKVAIALKEPNCKGGNFLKKRR